MCCQGCVVTTLDSLETPAKLWVSQSRETAVEMLNFKSMIELVREATPPVLTNLSLLRCVCLVVGKCFKTKILPNGGLLGW